ncbi:MAG: TonB-dependent receptor domain-containing protein [Saprospiraceae bacterium]
MKNYLLLFLTTIFLASTTYGQGRVSGTINDSNGKSIDYANVLLLNAKDSTLAKGSITDSTGQYLFENIANGDYLINASMIGYAAVYSIPFTLNPTRSSFEVPSLTLSEASVDMGQVTVTAEKPFIEMRADKLVVNVGSSAVLAGNTALEVLRKSPGVTVDNNDNITLKGRQGVMVQMNGKQTYLSTEEVARMLESMPASSIESIEIINNPSAKYDAAGNAGIINIVLKKDKNLGFNGNIRVGGGLGLYNGDFGPFHKANGNIRFNYRQKKYNVFGSYNYWTSKGFNINKITRDIPFNNEISTFSQESMRYNQGNSQQYQLGTDYFITDKTTVGVLVNGRFGTWNNRVDTARSITRITGYNPNSFSNIISGTESQNNWLSYTLNANMKHEFEKGKTLSFDMDYSNFANDSEADYINSFLDSEMVLVDENPLQSTNRSDVIIQAAKIDYTHSISDKFNIETGAKASLVKTDNEVTFYKKDNENWVVDSTQTNNFIYQEDIYAAYLNFNATIGKFSIQGGLRGEYTNSLGESVTLDTSVARGYMNWFPSISVSHELAKNHSLSYSYSRRIDRPTYQDLNPFVFFLDQYTFERGNPLLQPQFTNSLSLTYGYMNAAYLTFNYSRTTDAMTEIIRQDDSLQVTFQTEENIAQFDNFSINLSTPIPVTKWWMMRVNLTTFYNKFYSEYSDASVIDRESWAANAYWSNNFTINKKIRAEVSANYQSAMNYGIIDMAAQWGVDAGFNMSVLDGKGRLSFNVNDIFNTRQFGGIIQQENIDANINNKWESRRLFVSFSYNFGNNDVKPNRRRKTATADEQNRVSQ